MTMQPSSINRRLTLALAGAALLRPSGAWSQAWPAGKPVRLIVGFPPGGGVDTLARVIADPLAEALKTTVIVENRAGAGGLLATEMVAKAPSDGYMLYLATPGSFTIWPNLRKLGYNPATDFAPISVLVTMPNVLVVAPNAPYRTVQELITAAKAARPEMSYASGGNGTIGQIAGEQFKLMSGAPMQHIPYKGTSPALTDVMAGVVALTFSDPSVKTFVDSGKLRALAVTTSKRSSLFPDLPTMAESGMPGYDVTNWYGLVAPANTPGAIVETLNQALVGIMKQPDVRKRLAGGGMEATSSKPKEFGELMARERAKWGDLIRKVGIKVD